MDGVPKKESRCHFLLPLSLVLNLFTAPVAIFIGTMATASPTSSALDFWKVFLSIEGIPLLIIVIGLVKCREKTK